MSEIFESCSSHASAAPLLPVADDEHIAADLDVAMSTALTLVVHAQLELADTELDPVPLALVIPRSQCLGERPRLAALVEAAQAAVARATRGGTRHQARRVLTQVGGRPHLIPLF
jgi:hypothetical protein